MPYASVVYQAPLNESLTDDRYEEDGSLARYDAGMLDVVGFDTATLKLSSAFIGGEI